MDDPIEKRSKYLKLVEERKACDACAGLGLTNPSRCCDGQFDSEHIGPWSGWQGNLDAEVLVIGQEWGDVDTFQEQRGHEQPNNSTNALLIDLLAEIGISIAGPAQGRGFQGRIFLTNAVLCLKRPEGGLGGAVRSRWFKNCRTKFLKPLIETVRPKHVVCLGGKAYEAVLKAFELPRQELREAVATMNGIPLPTGGTVYAVYHCGRRNQNFCRKADKQKEDWRRLGERMKQLHLTAIVGATF